MRALQARPRGWVSQRKCLACGYAGADVQHDDHPLTCPRCGEDLYTRPPRSYAELEGLRPPAAEPGPAAAGAWRRWLAALAGPVRRLARRGRTLVLARAQRRVRL